MRINCLPLLYIAFQHCRCELPETETFLGLIQPLIIKAQTTRNLMVDLPDESLQALSAPYQTELVETTDSSLLALPPAGAQLFNLCALGIQEARRLLVEEQLHAVCSLGYVLHNLPYLVNASHEFDRGDWMFCFRVAAFDWPVYSLVFQEALCDLAGLKLEDISKFLTQERFAINMSR